MLDAKALSLAILLANTVNPPSWLYQRMQHPRYKEWRERMQQPSEEWQQHYCMKCPMDQRWR